MTVTIPDSIESYLNERSSELSASSIQNHTYQLKQFREWCASGDGIECLDDLDPIDLSRFRRARARDINANTMYNQLSVVRLHLRFCKRMGWVDEELPESIVLPSRDGRARDRELDSDRAKNIMDDLEQYAYASLDYCVFVLAWTCGFRCGALRGLDVRDIHVSDRYIELVHRPETGTPLKNGHGSEREVNLHGWVADVLTAWIEDRRTDSIDSHGREPLLSTRQGRISRTSIRRKVYSLTDCTGVVDGPCDCKGKCSDSVAPHDLRRSSISCWLRDGHDKGLTSDRYDLSVSTLDEHYDVRTESEKREVRRDAFDM
jgi:integrase